MKTSFSLHRKILALSAALLIAGVGFSTARADNNALAAMPELPNPNTNPGAVNPNVTPADLYETICKRGWTRTVRPPFRYTNNLKHKLLRAAGLPSADIHDFELDHLVPLEVGGAPWDPRNLWLQPLWGKWNAHVKDQLENKLNHLVCDHELTLAQAQYMIATNWIATYKRYVSPTPLPVKQGWGNTQPQRYPQHTHAAYGAYEAYKHVRRYQHWHHSEHH